MFSRIRLKWPDSSRAPPLGQIWPASDHGRNLVHRHSATMIGCRRIPAPHEFQRPTLAGFRQSDIKCACKDEEFNFEKRFTVFKTVNSFSKIKEAFTIKLKMIFVNHYFRPYQTP
jgi:hypothetical protein